MSSNNNVLKVKFSSLDENQEFYAYKYQVGNKRKVFKKLIPKKPVYYPEGSTECRFCNTPLEKWVNATMVADSSLLHYCPEDEVFIYLCANGANEIMRA